VGKAVKLTEVSAVAEIVAAVAVVISIFYVASEVQKNTRAQNAATIQAISLDVRAVTASIPIDVRVKVRNGEPVSREEEYEYALFVFSALRAYESWWLQRQLGTLSDEVFEVYITSMGVTLDDSLARRFWDDPPINFIPDFQAYVDEYLAENPLSQ